ncbi:unnamed protein product [Rhizoctonia solani]|uniref:AB hydrolase-1 domain-containing protein n=1 Tax=Rhizoctonia solani TaxID=456999 RepID=A0A8H3I059_9AGAM|nr:unnamed protein product [Rhizoctonia solani]
MWMKLWVKSAIITSLLTSNLGATYVLGVHSRQTSSGAISWFTCPDVNSTQCAFFDVPMDYMNPNSGSTVSIFLRKSPATAPADQRLGSILFNPGGPGGSGSATVGEIADQLRVILDGRYDIIGFDPRAVNLTGPPTACYDVEYKVAYKAYQVNM